jgi:hypothetical protein
VRITFRRYKSLPPLAWLCEVDSREGNAWVHMGRYVEAQADFVVEGVWDGDFRGGGFDRTDRFFGSGVRFRNDRAVFVPSMATTDSLFVGMRGADYVVSNSLPFLLAFMKDRLDPRYEHYDRGHDSICMGIQDYERRIPTVGGSVERLMFHNLEVAPGEEGTEEAKPMPPPFPDYESYYAYLDSACSGFLRNARDAARARPLGVFSTQSTGYDTTAVNAVASRYGVDSVFTVPQSKGRGRAADGDARSQDNDDGSEIARQLGLTCTRIDRRLFERDFRYEDLFYACLYKPGDANLLGIFEHVIGPTALLTGALGEIWYPRENYATRPGRVADYITPYLRRWDLIGHGLSEVRLAVGLIQVPIPYVGAQRRQDIVEITESSAMSPWRLGTEYDRPIPRRIAESRGLPRNAFGQRKLAASVEFALPRVFHSPDLQQEFLGFLRQHDVLGRSGTALLSLVRRWNEFLLYHTHVRWRLYRILRLAGWRGSAETAGQIWLRLNGAAHCFAVNRVAGDYSAALQSSADEWEPAT